MNLSRDVVHMGFKYGQVRRPANVELREKQNVVDPQTGQIYTRRAFFSCAEISAGEEILWNYIYHRKVKGSGKVYYIVKLTIILYISKLYMRRPG